MSTGRDNEPSISSIYRLGDEVLFSIFGAQPLELGNHIPITLQDDASFWLVHKGTVDVFVVRIMDEQVISPRTHLFRVKAGQAIFGLNLAPFEGRLMLVAVGSQNAAVSQIERAKFEETLHNPLTAKLTSKLLDGWIRNFSESIQQDLPVRQVLALEGSSEMLLKADEVARAKREVVWVNVQTGMMQFVGRQEIPLMTGGDFLPVCDKTWVRAHRDTKLRVLSTLAFITAGFTWEAIEKFHEIVLNSILWNIETVTELDVERVKQRQEQDAHRMDLALRGLSEILVPPHDDVVLRQVENEDEILVTACRIVGNALQVKIQPRPDPIDGRHEKQTLEDIIRTSGLRMRQVMLRDAWWLQENGPLLAFTETDRRPVALTPTPDQRYIVHDPTTRTKQALTPALARQLAPLAFQFYRTLPYKALDAGDLLRFGFVGSGSDLRRVILAGILGGILSIVVPLVIGRIFDSVVPAADRSQLLQLTLLLVASTLAAALFQIVQNIAVLRIEMRLDSNLQTAVWDRLLTLPTPFFRDFTAGDLASRAIGANMIRRRVSGTVVLSILTSIFSLFNFALLFFFSPPLAALATGIVVFAAAVSWYAGRRKVFFERQLAEIEGFLSGLVFQFIVGISKFRVAGVEGRAFSEWARHFTEQKRLAYSAGMINNGLVVFNNVYPILAAAAIFALVASTTDLTTGAFLAFNAAFTVFLLATLTLSSALISVLEVIPMYERLKPILHALPEVDETKADPGQLSGEIEVSRLSFRYDPDGPLIVSDLSLHIQPGQFVAIVGPSGSGKSTLFRLLLGFEEPDAGSVFYDGQDLANLDITAVRQQLGVVLQNGQLMTGDIFSNIVGVAALTLDDAWEAAAMAGLKQDIEEMPMGMHTVISEGGSTLSGGQRQRLLIARAIARKPKILFFDEATSALDNRTQAIVSESLERLDATRVVIAHRLSTIVNADQIIVLDRGRVVQQGQYADLIRQPGVFQELAKRQLI